MEIDIREYLRPLFRWWWLILLSTFVAGASSYYAVSQQPEVYTSSTSLMIGSGIENPNPSNNDLYITQKLAGTYVELAKRDSTQRAATDAVGLRYRPEIFVQQFNDTNVIDIYVTDTNPQVAQAVAAALAEELVALSPSAESQDEVAEQLLARYEDQIEQLQVEIEEKRLEIGELISASEIKGAQDDLSALESNLREVSSLYANLRSSTQQGATNTVRIIEQATLPEFPRSSGATATILTAASIGFVLAASAAYLLEYLDDTVKTPDRLAKLTGVPTITGIAEIKGDDKVVAIAEPRSPTTEAFRVIRTAIQFADGIGDRASLLVTSAIPSEGKSTIAANLAAVIAQAGHRVLLIDSDLRRPSQHTIFQLPSQRGLTSILLEFHDEQDEVQLQNLIEDTVQLTPVNGLHVLTCGPIPPNPSELLGAAKMRHLLDRLAEEYDYLVLDSPPMLSATDAAVMSAHADGVLYVARTNISRREPVAHAISRLQDVNANIIGCVMNMMSERSDAYAQYYHDPSYPSSTVKEQALQPAGGGHKFVDKLRERLRQRSQTA